MIKLAETALQHQPGPPDPIHVAMLFWPEFGGAAATAVIFGVLFRTRLTPVLALGGMILLAGGAAVLTGVATGPHALVVVGSGLIGLGVGASVSPALYIAGFSLASAQLQRVFALVELLRGVAAFMIAPILLHLAMTVSASPAGGIGPAMWVCFGLTAGGGLLALVVGLLGRARLQRPDLDLWEQGEKPAWESPELGAAVRGAAGPTVSGSPVPGALGGRTRRSRSPAQ
jgi:hypothetical protein